ncbi:MAG: hypothetical protein PUC29_08065 [Clostridia bacterium]|nr:hypothetical protein [Clostridia bacterium]
MKIASLKVPDTERLYVRSFGGYDKRPGRNGITFTDMENMTGKHYPLLATRDKRGILNTGDFEIFGILSLDLMKTGSVPEIVKGALLADCRGRLRAFYNDGGVFSPHDIMNTSYFLTQEKKTTVVSGSSLYFFPDAKKVDLMDYASSDTLECSATYNLGAYEGYFYELKFTPCDIDGNEVSGSSEYVCMTRPYYKLTDGAKGDYLGLMGFNIGFSDGDTVKISGLTDSTLNGSYFNIQRIDRVNKKVIIMGAAPLTQDTGTVYINRSVPPMDYVISAGNRLWGCRYGIDSEGNSINEIYASALGDPKNWRKYRGISTDSWTASVGAPGAFTGAVSYNGYPIFFKEDCIIKVFGDYPAEFTLSESRVRGVEAGSSDSIAVVNDTLYYKSYSGIVKYDGGLPRNVDAPLGNTRYKNAVAGAAGSKYYVSMEDEEGKYHLFVYDSEKNIWHREDCSRALSFCRCGSELFMLKDDGKVYGINNTFTASDPTAGSTEADFPWYCITDSMGYEHPEKKYVSCVSFRIEKDIGAETEFFIEYDGDGVWHSVACSPPGGASVITVPVLPRSCDSFRIKISGKGGMKLLSAAVSLEIAEG